MGYKRMGLLHAGGRVKQLKCEEALKGAGPVWKGKQISEHHSLPN